MVKVCRVAVIIHVLEVTFDTTERITEKFEAFCQAKIDFYASCHLLVNLRVVMHSKAIVEFFYKNHLIMAGYCINVDKNLENIVTNLIE